MSIHHSPLRLCEESYSDDRYVQRVRLEESIAEWLQNLRADRTPILSLVGPPGAGKSWLLARIHQMWQTNDAFVLFLDARQLMDINQHYQIMGDIIQKANTACTDLSYPHDLLPSLSALAADITQRLCARCADQRFLVLVDGCDDLASQEEFDRLQREYLRPFFGPNARCFRMIIAHRLQLTDYTLRTLSQSLVVGVFEDDTEIGSHRTKLSSQLTNPVTSWPVLPPGCDYRWNHPYINCYLLHSSQDEGVTLKALDRCSYSLIERSHSGQTARYRLSVYDELRTLALITQKYPVGWTSRDFRDTIGNNLDDAYLRRGLVSARKAEDDMSGPTYQVIDGLRELLAVLPEKELRS